MATRQDLDLSREYAPSPAWLREYASSMKLEAQVLGGHISEALVDSIMVAGPGEVVGTVETAVKATQAHAMLIVAADALLEFASALDAGDASRPEVAGDPRGELDR